MLKKKQIRDKGKIKFSEYFKDFQGGERVAVVKEHAVKSSFPQTLQGRTGTIEGKRGNSYIINMKIGKGKKFIIHPVHLKKLK